jgi:serine phosphatase RsbU (regulator of sigma subunit)/FixJ family two-component response regulator
MRETPVTNSTSTRRETSPRLLIADDQPDVLEALRLLLKGEGYRVTTVASPTAVLQALQAQEFDLLLMDLNYTRDTTSGREGLDLLARIQAIDSTLPVVVMTAWASVELALESMHQGVGDFVQKPWENARLLDILRTQIERGKARRQARRLEEQKRRLEHHVAAATDLTLLLKRFAEHLQHELKSQAVAIFTRAPGHRAFWPAATMGLSEADNSGLKFELDDRFLGIFRGPIEVGGTDLPQGETSKLRKVGSRLIAPIRVENELIAFLSLGSKATGEEYSAEDLEFLTVAANQIAGRIKNLQWRGQNQEFEAARDVQQGLLPKQLPQIPGYDLSGMWQPARLVGGDYFDVFALSETHAVLCIADVVGKGMPAALLMSNVQAATRAIASRTSQPKELCAQVNQIVCNNTTADRFITFFYGLLDAAGRRLAYTNAGHNPPLLLRRDGSLVHLQNGGTALGIVPDWKYKQGEVGLTAGDRLVLFTDGVTEARNSEGEEFGETRLVELLTRHRHFDAAQLQKKIFDAIGDFSGRDFQDDATLIVMAVE